MRIALLLGLFAAVAAAHGGRGTSSAQPAISGPQVFRHGGVDGAPKTLAGSATEGGWETWWAYNREFIISKRMRGVPISGSPGRSNKRLLNRKELREGKLYDVMLRALDDKNHLVRSSAAVALGKFGLSRANRQLERHTRFPGEGWFDVREGAIYAMGALALPENRLMFKVIAGDKKRPVKERGLALVSLALDGTQDSIDLVTWHLNYHRSGLNLKAWQMPTLPEEEKRRVAAHMLGFSKKADVNGLLYKAALGSRKWGDGVRGLAVTALGRRKARDHIDSLFRLMARRDTEKAVQRSIPLALGMMLNRGDSEVRSLARFFKDYRRDNIIQHFTAMGLAEIGGPEVVDIFEDIINRNVINDDRDRAWLYLALGQIAAGSTKAQEILLNRYQSARTTEIRAALALACGMGRVRDAVPLTIKLLEKSGPPGASSTPAGGAHAAGPRTVSSKNQASFMLYALLGLGLHGDPVALPIVRKTLKKIRHPAVRHNAAIALALLRRTDAIPELLELLKETGNQYTKAAAIMALGLMPEATDQLVDGLIDAYRTDSYPDHVRALAIIGLGALGDPRPIPLSASLTRNYNYHIRSFAIDELALLQ